MHIRTWIKDSIGNRNRVGDFTSLAEADVAAKKALLPYPAGVYIIEIEYRARVIHGSASDPAIQKKIEDMDLPDLV